MTRFTLPAALAAILCCACATTGVPGQAETLATVLDELGKPMPGTLEFYSGKAQDLCEADDTGCSVRLSPGYYSLTFRKLRAARMSAGIGGTTGDERFTGCLRARVQLVPGRKIVCKKTQAFNCGKGIYDNMDCGESTAQRYGYKPGMPGDATAEPSAPSTAPAPAPAPAPAAPAVPK